MDGANDDDSSGARSVENGREAVEIFREERIGARMGEKC